MSTETAVFGNVLKLAQQLNDDADVAIKGQRPNECSCGYCGPAVTYLATDIKQYASVIRALLNVADCSSAYFASNNPLTKQFTWVRLMAELEALQNLDAKLEMPK